MKKESMLLIKDLILANNGDFFTSGESGAIESLRRTKKDFKIATIGLSAICVLTFIIRALVF